MNKINLGWYAFVGICGLVTGLCFSRAQYRQGRIDMAEEFKEDLMNVTEKLLKEREETE